MTVPQLAEQLRSLSLPQGPWNFRRSLPLDMHPLLREDLIAVTGFVGTFVALFLYTLQRQKKYKPPGPKGYPLIGSLFEWPQGHEWLTFTKWRDLYGDITYVNVAGTNIIVLNSVEAANALLTTRSTINSDRPYLHLASGIIGWKNSPIMCAANDPIFKPSRMKMLSTVGSNKALEGYVSMVEHEAHRFIYRLTSEPDPDRLEYFLRKLAGAIIMKLVYGYDVMSGDDEYVDLIEAVNRDLSEASKPGNFMVDFIPALAYVPRWFPGTSWITKIDSMRARLEEALTKPVNFVKGQLAAGTAQPSFVAHELERPDFSNEEFLLWTAQALYTGGADTTVSAILTFFLCMLLHPEVQEEAQKELDTVVGQDVLPTWKDRHRLPYINALIKETIRWGPVAPQGMPHSSNADDTYNGYFIPKKTIFIANIWGFARNSGVYPDPESFRPTRFLGPSPQPDPSDFIFGFGRRSCPGRLLAEATLFSVVTRLLSTMSIQKKIGIDGKPITPNGGYWGGTVVYPNKFEYVITPRSEKAKSLIMTVGDEPYGS
ncbi:cytochrome P450 [Flagelloscypha sp. PMI_526]|nr:cytochrome P450 [Flagelloscypha sp. PMI_526]